MNGRLCRGVGTLPRVLAVLTRMLKPGLVASVGAVVLTLVPATAVAGLVTASSAGVVFEAGAGEANHVLFAEGSGTYHIIDTGAPLTAAGECKSVTANEATCPATSPTVSVGLGDHADFAFVTLEHKLSLDAGAGDDVVTTDARSDDDDPGESRVDGGPGRDTLQAGGRVMLLGGDGDDGLKSQLGAVTLIGGAGADFFSDAGERAFSTVSYRDRTASINADDDGIDDDGEVGEGDNVGPGIDRIEGGRADDTLVSQGASLEGREGNDVLDGRAAEDLSLGGGRGNDHILAGPGDDFAFGDAGDDIIRAGGDDDWLEGGRGNDVLHSGNGVDFVFGNEGADRIFGGLGGDILEGRLGNDLLVGGPGRDSAFGGPGNDTLRMWDRRADRVIGGGGTDRARVDAGLDRVRLVESLI